ncbi:hypothetical protein NC652_037297 [Populus alba x Populus x berolinensis]|nr:hypothetical protein NC652_037297 [Populus alba x Populus x berolinensis]
MSPYETNLQRFLPCNDYSNEKVLDGELDPYSSDHFRMYEFKVRRCTRSRSHDWTDCPFAHPGEKARRRDPRRFHYSGTVCPEFKRGGCSRGENCEFSHGVLSVGCTLLVIEPRLAKMARIVGERNVNSTTPWNIDVSFSGEDQPQFILSPSTPTPSSNFFNGDCSSNKGLFVDDKINDHNNIGDGGLACSSDPDLGWVNELLM